METFEKVLRSIWSQRPLVDTKASKNGFSVAASHFGMKAHWSLLIKQPESSEAEGVFSTRIHPDSVSTKVAVSGGEHSVELTFGLGKQELKAHPAPKEEIPEDVDLLD